MTMTARFFRRPPSWSRWLALSLLPACAAGCASVDVGSSPPPEQASAADAAPPKDSVSLTPEAQRASGISVAVVTAEPRAGYFQTPALLQVNEARTSRPGSLVDGVVTGANAQVGERVRQGQELASIHSHAVHDAWAGYRRAVADRQRATAELAYATSAVGRASRLLAKKAVSAQEMERATTDRAAAEQALAIAESEVRRALEELEHLGISAERVEAGVRQDAIPVRTPVGGVVLQRLVTSGAAVTVGTPLFVVSDLSTLWAIAEVDETRLPLLRVGRTAELTVAAYPERSFTGRVVAIGDSVNPETRRVTARIQVDNRDGLLKPEMFATVRLATGEESRVAIVPSAAVQQIDQQSVVFVEAQAGTFQRRAVTVGAVRDGMVEVTGIEPGARIAVTNAFLLKSKLLESEQPE